MERPPGGGKDEGVNVELGRVLDLTSRRLPEQDSWEDAPKALYAQVGIHQEQSFPNGACSSA